MKKMAFKIILLLIVFSTLVFIEHLFKKSPEGVEMTTVYVVNQSVEFGDYIKKDMLNAVEIPKILATDDILNTPIAGYSLAKLSAGEFVYNHQWSEISPLDLKSNERLITVKCDVVEGNGWLLEVYEIVDVVMITQSNPIILEDARIYRIMDEYLENKQKPVYISLIVNKDQAMKYFLNISKSQVFISKKN